ncbi:MAG: hypothetical protein ACE5HU_06550 [Acidobacteriota bacterium]
MAILLTSCAGYGKQLGGLGGTIATTNNTVVDVGESFDDLKAKNQIKATVYNEWVDFVRDYKKGEKLAASTYRTLKEDFKKNPDVEQWDALNRAIEIIEALSKTAFDWYDQMLNAVKGEPLTVPLRE